MSEAFSIAPPRTFDEIARLGTDVLRAIALAHDPIERLHAARALALRLGPPAGAMLAAEWRGEPHPGVRRHFIVVLAGLGETAAVVAFAEHDPSPEVRAVGCQYVATRSAPLDPEAAALLCRALVGERSSLVRRACVVFAPTAPPLALRDAVVDRLGDEDGEVRREAIARVQGWVEAGEHALSGRLLGRLAGETDEEARRVIVAFGLRYRGGIPLLETCLELRDDLVELVLEAAINDELVLPWTALAPLARRDGSAVRARVAQALRVGGATEADAWLLEGMLAASGEAPERVVRERWDLQTALEERFRMRTMPSPDDRTQRLARQTCVALEAEHERLLAEADPDALECECCRGEGPWDPVPEAIRWLANRRGAPRAPVPT